MIYYFPPPGLWNYEESISNFWFQWSRAKSNTVQAMFYGGPYILSEEQIVLYDIFAIVNDDGYIVRPLRR